MTILRTSARTLRTSTLAALPGLLVATACGGGSGGGGGETTVDTWSDYCIATFTEETVLQDFFGDEVLTAAVDDQFVIASLGADETTLIYIANTGPEELTVLGDGGSMPFTTSCTVGNTVDYLAVFSTVTVYAEEELSTPLCELTAGTAELRDTMAGSGYSTTGSGVNGGITYEVILNAFSDDCGDADRGYISVPQTQLWGSTTWLVPIANIAGPG